MHIQNVEDVPGEYYFRYDEFGADTEVPPHSHSWGHLNYTPHGSMCMDTAGQHWVSPPQYGVWVPPGVVHSCHVAHAVVYRSIRHPRRGSPIDITDPQAPQRTEQQLRQAAATSTSPGPWY